MNEGTEYYRFPIGNVILRKKGDVLEKKGRKGIWEDASDQLWRFADGDLNLEKIDYQEDDEGKTQSGFGSASL